MITELGVTRELPGNAWDGFDRERKTYLIEKMPTITEARIISAAHPGSIYYGAYYLTHVMNNDRIHTYVHAPVLRDIRKAQEVTAKITGRLDVRFTYTGMARQIMEWLDVEQVHWPQTRNLLPAWHYQLCRPSYVDNARMFDLQAAYWQMAEKCQSPTFITHGGRILWTRTTREQQTRWDTMREELEQHKRLRLGVVGVNSVGWRGVPKPNLRSTVRLTHGRSVGMGNPIGQLQPLSILAVRCTYEVTQIQAEASESVYSNGDCVVTESDTAEYWDSLGLRYTVKASGPADICAMGAWKIGEKQTIPYCEPDLRHYAIPRQPLTLANTEWHRKILHA